MFLGTFRKSSCKRGIWVFFLGVSEFWLCFGRLEHVEGTGNRSFSQDTVYTENCIELQIRLHRLRSIPLRAALE